MCNSSFCPSPSSQTHPSLQCSLSCQAMLGLIFLLGSCVGLLDPCCRFAVPGSLLLAWCSVISMLLSSWLRVTGVSGRQGESVARCHGTVRHVFHSLRSSKSTSDHLCCRPSSAKFTLGKRQPFQEDSWAVSLAQSPRMTAERFSKHTLSQQSSPPSPARGNRTAMVKK